MKSSCLSFARICCIGITKLVENKCKISLALNRYFFFLHFLLFHSLVLPHSMKTIVYCVIPCERFFVFIDVQSVKALLFSSDSVDDRGNVPFISSIHISQISQFMYIYVVCIDDHLINLPHN